MFHVSTLLPYEKHDPQKVSRQFSLCQSFFLLNFFFFRSTILEQFYPTKYDQKFNQKSFLLARAAPEKKTHWQRYSVCRIFGSRQHELQPSLHQVALFAHIYLGAS